MLLVAVVGVASTLLGLAWGHGRLIEPPSRASAWRYGFQTPPNYNDHELYCGGFSRQYERNGGKCGVCGDPWDVQPPRPHEFGGVFGQGVVVRRYAPAAVATIRIELTASHFGFFEFRLCSNYRNTTQECLDRKVLRLASSYKAGHNKGPDPLGVKFYPRDGNKIYEMRYKLPDMKCAHCVLQWTYTAGNNWGQCPNGTGMVGCGPQETFRACADIQIGEGSAPEATTPPDTSSSTTVVPTSDHDTAYDGIRTLIIFVVSLFLVFLLFTFLYIYYYQVGKRIKAWLRRESPAQIEIVKGVKVPPPPNMPAPVPPPRVRRNSSSNLHAPTIQHQMYNVSLKDESLA